MTTTEDRLNQIAGVSSPTSESSTEVTPTGQVQMEVTGEIIRKPVDEQIKAFSGYYGAEFGAGARGLVKGLGGLMAMTGHISDKEMLDKYNNDALEAQEQAKINSLEKNVPIWYPPRWIGPAVQGVPQMLAAKSMEAVGGVAGSAVGSGLSAISGGRLAPVTPVLNRLGGQAGMYAANAGLMAGQTYTDLIHHGIDRDTARNIALSSGMMQGALQTMQLRQLGAFSKKAIYEDFAKKEGAAAFKTVAVDFLKNVGLNIAETDIQHIVGTAHTALAGYLKEKPELIPSGQQFLDSLVHTTLTAAQAATVFTAGAAFAKPLTNITVEQANKIAIDSHKAAALKMKEEKIGELELLKAPQNKPVGSPSDAVKNAEFALSHWQEERNAFELSNPGEPIPDEIKTGIRTAYEDLKAARTAKSLEVYEQTLKSLQDQAAELAAKEKITPPFKMSEKRRYLEEQARSVERDLRRAQIGIAKSNVSAKLKSIRTQIAKMEQIDTPEARDEVAVLKVREAIYENVGEVLDNNSISPEDLKNLAIRISDTAARRLAAKAYKSTLQGYALAKEENRNMDKARVLWDKIIRNSDLSAADRDKLPASSQLTAKNLPEQLKHLEARIQQLASTAESREADAAIKAVIQKISKGEKQGFSKFEPGTPTQRILSAAKRFLANPSLEPQTEIEQAVKQDLIDRVDLSSPQQLKDLAYTLEAMIKEGHQAFKGKRVAKLLADENFIRNELIPGLNAPRKGATVDTSSVTAAKPKQLDNKEIIPGSGITFRQFGEKNFSWRGQWRIALQDAPIAVREKLVERLSLTKNVEAVKLAKQEAFANMMNRLSEASGLKESQVIKKFVEGAKQEIKFTSKDSDGVEREHKMTINEAVQYLNQRKDKSLEGSLKSGNKFSDDTWQKMTNEVNKVDPIYFKLADGLMKHYQDQGKRVSELYRDATGHELDIKDDYSGFAHVDRMKAQKLEAVTEAQEMQLQLDSLTKWGRSTGKPKSFLARTQHENALLKQDAFMNAIDQIRKIEQWNGFRNTERIVRALNDPEVARVMDEKFPGLRGTIKRSYDDARAGAMEKDKAYGAIVGRIMKNASSAFLKLKVFSLPKQMTGIGALAVNKDMPVHSLLKGVADYHQQKAAADALITGSSWYKTRYDDFYDTATGVLSNKDINDFKFKHLDDMMLAPMVWGDKWVARVGGYAAFLRYKELGYSDVEALNKAGDLIRTTQATNNIDELSEVARSPGWRIYAQFMQAPSRLFEYQIQAGRDFSNHPSIKTAGNLFKTVLVAHVAQAAFSSVDALYKYAVAGNDENKKEKAIMNVVSEFIIGPTWAVIGDPLKAAIGGAKWVFDKEVRGIQNPSYTEFDPNLLPLKAAAAAGTMAVDTYRLVKD